MTLLLLGPPRIERGGVPIEVSRRKAIALMAYLAVTRQSHSRDALATMLWPDCDQSRALANLRRVLVTLKNSLDGNGLVVDRESIGLDQETGPEVDVNQFRSRLAEYRAHDHPEGDLCPTCLTLLTEAAGLYRDELLADLILNDCPEFEEWRFFQAESLRLELADVIENLVRYYSTRGEFEPAISFARRWATLDPTHEPAHQYLMQLYAWAGQWPAALRQYEECTQVLERELGVAPLEETTQLYEAIKTRRPPPPPASQLQPIPLDGGGKRIPPDGDARPGAPPTSDPIAPLGSASGYLYNLPAQSTPFIDREEELTTIAHLLLDETACRLLTLVGPGGVGKTRLALQAAGDAIDAFPDGVFFVPFASVSSADFLVSAIAEALNFSFYSPEDPKVQLLSYLREKEMLLVMDNFEHLVTGADLLTDLLKIAPEVTILVTSRERLNLHAEWLLELEGLAYPKDVGADGIEGYSAVQLFLQSARRVRPDFSLSQKDKQSVIHICQLVDGMPLGIELAAAWVRLLPCEEIAREIENNLGFLTSSLRDVPERHQSLRAVFEHSWNLLSAEEREVFSKLSVFLGGFRREAAEQVAGASLPLLLALVDKSLLRSHPSGRFEMLEILRQYAADKLQETPEEKELAHRLHCRYFTEFLHQREKHLRGGRQQEALEEIAEALDNVRAGWRWALERGMREEIDKSLECLYYFYEIRSWFQEGEEIFRIAADRLRGRGGTAGEAREEKSEILGKVLARRGGFAHRLGLYEKARELLRESLSILRHLGVQREVAFCLNNLGDVARMQGEYAEAKRLLQESIAMCKKTGDRRRMARALNYLGIVAGSMGEYTEAKRLFQESLAILKGTEDRWKITNFLNNLGIVAYYLGEYAEARQLFEESLAIYKEFDDRQGIAGSLNNLGKVAYDLGEYTKAKQLYQESLMIYREIGNRWGIALVLNNLGTVACALGQYHESKNYLHAALKTAVEMAAVRMALEALVGIAELKAREGDKTRALEVLVLVLQHPAGDNETKDRAKHLLSKLESLLPPEVITRARERGKTGELEEEIEKVLAARDGGMTREVIGIAT